ncbi:uncharacterized protein LOC100123134 isoform X2 [Nasonia vitripennis]|uniref:PDZ domain-containing protein n=1 Tax=Nasonia vitripennis TaxID=7425 RepID=A0A7M7IY33_NASVI|nr:uncharacterized protein LOC100123134 isoform X2 [Nasonia vitripennis]
MKITQHHPLISATARRVEDAEDGADTAAEPVIRLKLDKPAHWDWQLTTTADALPVIQLLDKDGKLLVETSGRVAQRARGSFRDGLKSHESFPQPVKEEEEVAEPAETKPIIGNRNYEGFSSKFGSASCGFQPRKSRSETTVASSSQGRGARKVRKRHSSIASELQPQTKKDGPKRYSAGDYLRQQILEDLSKRCDVVGEEEPSQIARNRYKRMKAHLRSQSDVVQRSNDASEEKPEHLKELTNEETTLAGKRLNKEDLDKIRSFLQQKIQAKMQEEMLLSSPRADAPRENSVLRRAMDVRKRLSDCARDKERPGALKNYRTRKIRSDANIRFEPDVLEASKNKQKVSKKNSSGSDKRKVYRKTKSDVLLSHHLAGSTLDSEKDQPLTAQSNYPTRRIKSQDNFERSWREYKERKKQERLHKDSDHHNLVEEDFMKKPRWKDLQKASFCLVKNCKVCENSRSYVDPMKNPSAEEPLTETGERPSMSLQENYLRIDPSTNEPQPCKDEQRRERSPDFGYNSISKRNGLTKGGSCANSNVKKSDTFRVVDGRDDEQEAEEGNAVCYDYTNKTNEDIARDYFRRVYELLRRRQEEAKKLAESGRIDARCEDTSSSNYLQDEEEVAQCKRRRRRRKMEKPPAEGEDVLLVSPGAAAGRREAWRSINGSAVNCRGQQQEQQRQEGSSLAKRPRHPAPPPPPIRHSSSSSAANKENNRPAEQERRDEAAVEKSEQEMGSNLSRHNGKGLNGRRAQSSGNLCDSKGISVGKILVPCSRSSRERYKFCGSLPNHLDGKDSLDDDPSENNNVITDTISGNLGGTLPYKKKHAGAHYVDESTNTLDLVKHRSDESLDGDPWKYRQEGVDLVKCRHIESLRRSRGSDAGSTGSGCHHHHHHHEWRRNSSTLSRGRAHRSAELDVVGTLPKRRQDSTKRSAPSLGELGDGPTRASRISIDKIDDELLLKMVHKPDCELVKHRQQHHHQHHQPQQSKQKDSHAQHHSHQQGKCVDLKLHKLTTGGEPQDQGYASERSPEDEHPPSLPGQPFPSVTPENTFRVTLKKSTRGLGLSVSGGGTAGPVRVKRLFPQQPAALSNKLQPGDILLAANDIPLTGLTNYEALEVLRTTSSTVELVVSRLPGSDSVGSPSGAAPPPPPTRRDNPGLTLKIPLNPLPPLDVEPCGEFDIEMTKVAGSLGFTLRKADSSALGHYVRALVREPAMSDGRIQPGDKIVAVDGAPLSPMSHEEAVALLRQCGPTVRLRLYRDLAQTPVSALSPTEPEYPPRPAKTSLRQEAVDMLCDLAVRKLSPGTSSGGSSCPRQSSGTSCNSPRRLRRPATRSSTADTDEGGSSGRNNRHSHASSQSQETSDSDQCSIKTQLTNSQPETPANDIIDPPALYVVCDSSDSSGIRIQQQQSRPSYLDLQAPPSDSKPRFQYSFDSDGSENVGPVIVTDSDNSNFRDDQPALGLSSDEHDTALPNEPVSMPPQLSSTSNTSTAFSYKNPAYQSANPSCGLNLPTDDKAKISHSSEQDIPGKIMGADDPGGSKGLLKWKGVMFAPSDSDETDGRCKIQEDRDASESAVLSSLHEQGHEVFMVELTRGWNSRLGFSLQPEGENTVISVVHPDSVAAKDGRLKQGDILIMVNDESVEHMSTANIIDLLRKIRGSIGITVLRRKKDDAT